MLVHRVMWPLYQREHWGMRGGAIEVRGSETLQTLAQQMAEGIRTHDQLGVRSISRRTSSLAPRRLREVCPSGLPDPRELQSPMPRTSMQMAELQPRALMTLCSSHMCERKRPHTSGRE